MSLVSVTSAVNYTRSIYMIEASCVVVILTFRNEIIYIRWQLRNFCFIKNTQSSKPSSKAEKFKTWFVVKFWLKNMALGLPHFHDVNT